MPIYMVMYDERAGSSCNFLILDVYVYVYVYVAGVSHRARIRTIEHRLIV
jgi:hypothetical protein